MRHPYHSCLSGGCQGVGDRAILGVDYAIDRYPLMTAQILEQRLANIEAELTRINSLLNTNTPPQPEAPHPWWNSVFGVYADCPAFDEVEEFGKAWRKNQPDDVE
jgi:hypothetical protein